MPDPTTAADPSARAPRRDAARLARAARAARYDAMFAPWTLAAAGLLASFAFLFQPSLPLKAALFAVFLGVALSSGKKVSLPATFFVSLGIVAANLLVPVGKVLWRAGPLVVTETALLEGLDKAVTFEGLIYISKASIRPGLRIPGRFGSIVARAFVYYDRIIEYRGRLKPATLFADADALMLAVWDAPETPFVGAPESRPKRGPAGCVAAFALVAIAYAALAAGLLWRLP
ncbi:MAG: hypothetical protein JNG85_13385 [Spirochaetaceae bacterium]|nr:hypothetical protein [Spirochaetaceae bacterium]